MSKELNELTDWSKVNPVVVTHIKCSANCELGMFENRNELLKHIGEQCPHCGRGVLESWQTEGELPEKKKIFIDW